MARTLTTLPEELVLRILAGLHRLDDLYSVMLTNKLLYRISHDVPPADISRLALKTADFLPGIRPYQHFLLVPSARRLADWAVQSDERRQKLASAMLGGIDGLVAIAMAEAPVTLDDIRKTWRWKQHVLNPLSEEMDQACGRPSELEDFLTVCENPSLTLLAWVIYGELFHHSISYLYLPHDAQHSIPFDCVTRLKFMVYCIPDVNAFGNMGVEEPAWFAAMANGSDRFQQLSLHHGKGFLRPSLWGKAINEIMPGVMSDDGDDNWITDYATKDRLLIYTVSSSGTRALDILQAGRLTKRRENAEPLQELFNWLHDLHQKIGGLPSVESDEGDVAIGSPYDPWLKQTWVTLSWDMNTTLWDYGPYSLREEVCKQYGEGEEAWDAIRKAVREDPIHS